MTIVEIAFGFVVGQVLYQAVLFGVTTLIVLRRRRQAEDVYWDQIAAQYGEAESADEDDPALD